MRPRPSVKPLAYHNHALNELVYHQAKAHIGGSGNHMRYLKNSLRNIYFVKERIIAGQQQELDDEYEMMSLLCRNDEESEALSQWRLFSQLYGLRIQEEFSQFTLNMAKNQAKNSYGRNDHVSFVGHRQRCVLFIALEEHSTRYRSYARKI